MRWALAIVLVAGLARPVGALAQAPCGGSLLPSCPTPTPAPTAAPTPSPTPTPTPTPAVPVHITLRAATKLQSEFFAVDFSGRVTGPPALRDALLRGTPRVHVKAISTRFHRSVDLGNRDVSHDGTFSFSFDLGTDARYVVRAAAGTGITGGHATLRLRHTATVDAGGRVDVDGLHAFYEVAGPDSLLFDDGRMRLIGGFPRRAFLYLGRSPRRIPRIAVATLRQVGGSPHDREARFFVPTARLPAGRFHYAACSPGPGAPGLTPVFTGCGRPWFRLAR